MINYARPAPSACEKLLPPDLAGSSREARHLHSTRVPQPDACQVLRDRAEHAAGEPEHHTVLLREQRGVRGLLGRKDRPVSARQADRAAADQRGGRPGLVEPREQAHGAGQVRCGAAARDRLPEQPRQDLRGGRVRGLGPEDPQVCARVHDARVPRHLHAQHDDQADRRRAAQVLRETGLRHLQRGRVLRRERHHQ